MNITAKIREWYQEVIYTTVQKFLKKVTYA